MVKVRMSNIPEDSGEPIVLKKDKKKIINKSDKPDIIDELLDDADDAVSVSLGAKRKGNKRDDEEKKYIKTMVKLEDAGISLSVWSIESIEKSFRLRENSVTGDITPEYGIIINRGVQQSERYPKVDIELWHRDEEFRDRRFDDMIKRLSEAGFKFINV